MIDFLSSRCYTEYDIIFKEKTMQISRFNRFLSVFFTVVVVIGICAAALMFVHSRYVGLKYVAFPSVETAEELDNPYQGYYNVYGFRLSEKGRPLKDLDTVIEKDGDTKLVLIEINLNYYSDSEISDIGLMQLETVLSKWSETGKQLILRFVYDWDGKNEETEPQNINTVITHMNQVAPVVNKYADYVYILQGIFIGNYGEMNNSKHMSDSNVQKLCNKLASVIDPSIFLAVRTPYHWKKATKYNDVPSSFPAFGEALISRLGLYNDGMLGSDTDLGTYSSNDKSLNTREKALDFQKRLCNFVPSGGEVVIDNEYNDLENAIHDLNIMHVSYLNGSYDSNVLDKWRNTEYRGTDCFSGTDGYTYIKEHLGYRYEIRSSNIEFNTLFDSTALFSCILENVGFGSCLKELSASVIIKSDENDFTEEIPIYQDLRTLKSGGNMRLVTSIPVRDYKSGTYRLYLKITDTTLKTNIKIATNLDYSDDGYLLGEVNLSGFLK